MSAAAAALALFHSLSSPRAQKGTVTATMAPNLSPPKYQFREEENKIEFLFQQKTFAKEKTHIKLNS